MIGIILAEYHRGLLTEQAHWLIIAFSVLFALVGERLMKQWINGRIQTTRIHSGYFIPLVAGPFVISLGASELGARSIALGIFGAGVFFWVVIGAVVAARSIGGDGPATDQLPLHAAFLVAPGIACVAWMDLNPAPLNLIGELLTGVLAAMVLAQVMLLNSYAKLVDRRAIPSDQRRQANACGSLPLPSEVSYRLDRHLATC